MHYVYSSEEVAYYRLIQRFCILFVRNNFTPGLCQLARGESVPTHLAPLGHALPVVQADCLDQLSDVARRCGRAALG